MFFIVRKKVCQKDYICKKKRKGINLDHYHQWITGTTTTDVNFKQLQQKKTLIVISQIGCKKNKFNMNYSDI